MTKIKQFLTTPAGSWLKVFLAIMLGQLLAAYVQHDDFFSWDKDMWKKVLSATIAGFLPMIINALNPAYPLYGKQPKEEIVVDNPEVENETA